MYLGNTKQNSNRFTSVVHAYIPELRRQKVPQSQGQQDKPKKFQARISNHIHATTEVSKVQTQFIIRDTKALFLPLFFNYTKHSHVFLLLLFVIL